VRLENAGIHSFEEKNRVMKKVILVYGIIAGIIVSAIMIITQPLLREGKVSYDYGMLIGYSSMVISLSMVFFGIKAYRDQHLNGKISFGQGCKVGIMIALLASFMYATTWEIYYRTSAGDYMEKYTEHYLEKMEKEGASTEEINSMRSEMDEFSELYENFFIRFGMTLIEILPVGILLVLLSAAILKSRKHLPPT
jgi:hypothetical protein